MKSLEFADRSSRYSLATSFCALAEHLCRLVATETSTPLTTLLIVLVSEVGLGSADECRKFTLVLALHLLDSDDSRGLLVHHCAETSLAFDDDVGDTHLATKSRKEDNELDGVDIVRDDD